MFLNHPTFRTVIFPSRSPHSLLTHTHSRYHAIQPPAMAGHAAAVISAANKIPSPTTSYSVELSHQQSSFFSVPSIAPPPFKFSTVTGHCHKKRFVGAKATKSESGVDPKVGVAVYKPKSYEVLVSDAATSLFYALQEGKTRLEIEFPCVYLSIFVYSASQQLQSYIIARLGLQSYIV